jgi:hypothetical protein
LLTISGRWLGCGCLRQDADARIRIRKKKSEGFGTLVLTSTNSMKSLIFSAVFKYALVLNRSGSGSSPKSAFNLKTYCAKYLQFLVFFNLIHRI